MINVPKISKLELALHYLAECTPSEIAAAKAFISKQSTTPKATKTQNKPTYLTQKYWDRMMPSYFNGLAKAYTTPAEMKISKTKAK